MSELTVGLRARLSKVEDRYDEVSRQLALPETSADPSRIRPLGQELAQLQGIVDAVRALRSAEARLAEATVLLKSDDLEDLRDLARDEEAQATADAERLTDELRALLVPRDPLDDKNVLVEIRGGEGGEEAALFAADLFRMYSRYAERHRMKLEIMSQSTSEKGGFKEIIFRIAGKQAYSRLKFESGVHRVQRVPLTEAQGRIHTSTATVAVLPEADELDVDIKRAI